VKSAKAQLHRGISERAVRRLMTRLAGRDFLVAATHEDDATRMRLARRRLHAFLLGVNGTSRNTERRS